MTRTPTPNAMISCAWGSRAPAFFCGSLGDGEESVGISSSVLAGYLPALEAATPVRCAGHGGVVSAEA